MRSFTVSTALASLISITSASKILLPLYSYPCAEYGDGGANWKPVYEAIEEHTSVKWDIVINPSNGPGETGLPGDGDQQIIDAVAQLNSYDSVRTIGYVLTNYADSSIVSELEANITNWANWASYTEDDIGVDGIFFDEASTEDFDFLNEVITYARNAFSKSITTVCNFGATTPDEFYSICDIVVGFESCLNCGDQDPWEGETTIESNFPEDLRQQGAVIINQFTGEDYEGNTADASLLKTFLKAIHTSGLGWYYFCSAGYDDVTTTSATALQNAVSLFEIMIEELTS